MLQAQDLTITIEAEGRTRTLVEHLTFALNPGDKLAVIGEEGNGKSTLLKYLYDPALVPHARVTGRVLQSGRAGYLAQEIPEVQLALTVYEYLCEEPAFFLNTPKDLSRLCRTLGLEEGFAYSDQSLSTLSGGEKVKLQLLRLLSADPDCLLLDEPTNDIDIDTLEWLENFLKNTKLPVMYVSHDETLLENTANAILHLEQVRKNKLIARHTLQKTGYADYIARRADSLAKQTQVAKEEKAAAEKQQQRWQQIFERVQHEQNAISRADPGGGRLLKKKMHAVKSMERRFEREQENRTRLPDVEAPIFLSLPESKLPAGKRVLDMTLPRLSAADRVLAKDVHLLVTGPLHIGIVGKNGCGKTTLMQHIWQQLQARPDLKTCYMPQQYALALSAATTPDVYLSDGAGGEALTRARSYLGSLRYTREEMVSPVSALSGGQKAKLLFARMALEPWDVLLLDEPTRNFSPLSTPVIRSVLADFSGCIITVTHDRKYLREVCDTVYRLTPQGLLPAPELLE